MAVVEGGGATTPGVRRARVYERHKTSRDKNQQDFLHDPELLASHLAHTSIQSDTHQVGVRPLCPKEAYRSVWDIKQVGAQ